MNRKLWLALAMGCLLCAAAFVSAAEEEDYDEDGPDTGAGDEEKDVVVITKDNFDEKVKKAKFALVEFYAPWCGHCQKLKPEYAKAATALQEVDPSIVIAKCDATQESDLAQQFEVQGYPTIKWFVDGDVAMDYNGPRDSEGIVRWVKKKTGPPAATIEDKDGLATAEKEAEVLVLGFFKDFKGADFEAFNKAAQKAEDIVYVQTKSAEVGKAAGLSAPGVTVITNFEGEERGTSALKGKLTEEAIAEHVTGEKLPITVPFNDKNSPKIFGSGIDRQLLLVAKAADLKPDAKVFKAFRSVAPTFKGKLVFVTVDADGSSKDPVMNFFGLKEEDTPVLVGFFMGGNKKYRLKEAITEKAVKAFAEGVSSGTLTPEYKSAPEPEEPLDGGVAVVVGTTFDKIVKDEAKDVLLEVYAPWCGHCKSLEPIYKKLAKRFAKVDTVTIAKMDGTENEHPDVDVKGFPTLVFYPAGKDKAPVPFDGGDRSLKALTKFIKKHATHAFELPKKKAKDDDEGKDEL